jgi:outer membrane protein OmpA-like peptidoglycan-associated protein
MRINLCLFLFLTLVWLSGWTQSPSSVFVHFAFDKWELTTSSKATLDSLTDSLDITDRIELHGHCDAIGGNSYNEQLSAKRVQSVNKYLLSIGWEQKDIIMVQAHGKNMPLNKNISAEERKLNRRVEIKIIHTPDNTGNSLIKKLTDPKLTAGTNIVLRNINFVGGRSQALPESAPVLKELLDAMNAFPNLIIEIQGHICCQPGTNDGIDLATGTENLSVMRAKAIRDYLVRDSGIAPNRVSYRGFGHLNPVHPYPEKSDEERIANRRVEIKIISK